MRRTTYYQQPPVRGGRERLSSYTLAEVRRRVESIAARYSVRPSWVISRILAEALGVSNQPNYTGAGKGRRK